MKLALLTALLLARLTVFQGQVTVYARHLREHPLGPEAQAERLAAAHLDAAEAAEVGLAELLALNEHESAFDVNAESEAGALGVAQLLPRSRWGRAWLEESELLATYGIDARDELNVLWGAYALRDALKACGGSYLYAYGFYRTGRCVAGPRAHATQRLAWWFRWRLRSMESLQATKG